MPSSHSKPQGSQEGPSGFRLRNARRGDGEALQALLSELGYAAAADTQTVHWVISHPEIEIVVATDSQDRPVGMVALSHRPQLRLKGRIVTIDELVVTESWRRKGVGKALLKRVAERAHSLGVKRIDLHSHGLGDEGTLAFFAACGFQEAPARVYRYSAFEKTP